MLLSVALAGLVASALVYGIFARALRSLELRTPPRVALPPMTVIRPVRGLDPGLEDNARHALRVRYPAPIETIFVVDDESDPSFEVLQRVVASEPSDARVVVAGRPPPGRTGKLHAMIQGLRAARARTPLVCFADSDTRPAPGVVEELASVVVASHDVGSAFARVVGTCPPRTLGDVGYTLLLDGFYGPLAALASGEDGRLPFVMGQTMVLRRSALDASGGLEGSQGELVDDMHIGARLTAAGFRNVITRTPVAIVQHGMSFDALRETAVRWMIFGRTGVPQAAFNAPTAAWVALFFLGIAGALLSAVLGDGDAAAVFVATTAAVVIALEMLRRQQGCAPVPLRLAWAPFVVLALVPVWFARARTAKEVEWRGRSYALDRTGKLGAPSVGAELARARAHEHQMP